ncbi:hypothetical protein GBA52_015388 [Prunus armeniaca]|nr:hypothetical protein GBA52_015388 [Prunus armeniaca]
MRRELLISALRSVFSRESFMLSENLVFHLYIQPKSVPERALKQVECTKRTNEVIAASELLGKSTWESFYQKIEITELSDKHPVHQ